MSYKSTVGILSGYPTKKQGILDFGPALAGPDLSDRASPKWSASVNQGLIGQETTRATLRWRRYEGAEMQAFGQFTLSAGNGQQSRLEAWKAAAGRS
jgi:hypothetical protein